MKKLTTLLLLTVTLTLSSVYSVYAAETLAPTINLVYDRFNTNALNCTVAEDVKVYSVITVDNTLYTEYTQKLDSLTPQELKDYASNVGNNTLGLVLTNIKDVKANTTYQIDLADPNLSSQLHSLTAYKLYQVAEDSEGNISQVYINDLYLTPADPLFNKFTATENENIHLSTNACTCRNVKVNVHYSEGITDLIAFAVLQEKDSTDYKELSTADVLNNTDKLKTNSLSNQVTLNLGKLSKDKTYELSVVVMKNGRWSAVQAIEFTPHCTCYVKTAGTLK